MLEKLRERLSREGYFADLDLEHQSLNLSARNGRRRPGTNESATSYVASVFFIGEKFIISKPNIPKYKTWEVDTMEDVVEYLLTNRPNIPVGEENTWT